MHSYIICTLWKRHTIGYSYNKIICVYNICTPYLLGPVQFGQVSAEIITDYRIGIRCAQERSTSLKGNLAERLEIAGRSLVIPDFTALGLLFSPRVERALLNRTKNPTSRPNQGLQLGASDKLPSQPRHA